MGGISFDMFIYSRSEQCDFGLPYLHYITQRFRIYQSKLISKLKFILVKMSPDLGRLHDKHPKENQTLVSKYLFATTKRYNK